MFVAIDGHELECVGCRKSRRELGFDLTYRSIWANQHGREFELYHKECGTRARWEVKDGNLKIETIE